MLEDIVQIKRIHTPLDEARLSTRHMNTADYQFFQINKISLSDELEKEKIQSYVNHCVKQFIASLTDTKSPIVFRLKSNRTDRTISLFIGAKRKNGQSIAERFSSYFQTIDFHEVSGQQHLDSYEAQALITGIPAQNETTYVEYIESFVRFIREKDVMLEVVAKPIKKVTILQQLENLMDRRTKNSLHLKISHSESTATSETSSTSFGQTMTDGNNIGGGLLVVNSGSSKSEGTTSSNSDSKGITETVTKNLEQIKHQAMEYDHILEIYTERLQQALSSGLWKTAISIYTKNREDLAEVTEVYRSAYSLNAIEPYQVFPLSKTYQTLCWLERDADSHSLNIFHEKFREFSFLTGEELSYVLDVPKEQYNGYEISQAPRFSQNSQSTHGIPIGHIYDGEKKTRSLFYLHRNQLVKHLLVAGITGSGKTNTIFNLLKNVDVPFLIIEPAKKEYRGLQKVIPNLRIYTLGNEGVSPFRINPFYFPANVNIQQHIDNLKVIFNASFTMYASMPNILEQCINNIYIKKGWSLTTSRNIYQNNDFDYKNYFPTIEDLYYEIDSYTKELGYAQEQMQNIRAALLTRIKSLMTGGKGYMLNTVETIDIEELLQYPTVLELEAIADDDEKSLIIGLISIFIYEYLKANEFEFAGNLKHLLVFEEAHRIFANVNQHGSQENVNIKGKAVESLSHILSEIRAYGEGMIIVDQVPTKLAPDVLKNTNTKIIHRIVSKDDCEYVANSLGLSNEKVDFISKLTNGAALLYTDGMSSPAHLQILHGKENISYVSDHDVREHSQSYNHLLNYSKHMHPLTEIMLQNIASYSELKKEVESFYRTLFVEPLKNLQSNYQSLKENIIRHAIHYGFDMNIDVDDFVFSFVKEALFQLVKTNEKIKKQVNRRIFIERYIETCLVLLSKNYEIHKKEYALLELNQQKLGDEYVG
ncbi:ATP-binding protein [Ureibacillus sp. FSL K6-2830]|uniref:ATP-binding protein n=1 Tax=Ureibacillus sp. FSL K6-2830 TaxID=2954610 RepID=UPI0030F5CEAF